LSLLFVPLYMAKVSFGLGLNFGKFLFTKYHRTQNFLAIFIDIEKIVIFITSNKNTNTRS
jgi:hypothetical protein